MVCCSAYVYGSSDDVEAAWDDEEKQRYISARAPAKTEPTNACQPLKIKESVEAVGHSLPFRHSVCPMQKQGTSVLLSEQHLVDCYSYDGGCDGGWYTSA
ncbi:hypothetical protein DAPPUDRAFT_258974 [Daphnia pulex]|uniref:Peptidase C1A papain C-terminal domain-containing protein n=1 Tax=Daphnia pulex TaxID=6669 RepID=E9HGC4_DAPPU|nr:hypothetical protein DAPPUDRAFT_258974 [Daphnia pulex]|eukprot:EFX69200.1 hypothetical protein DAPPUDRAFT_258974 [Daphnia pulex]